VTEIISYTKFVYIYSSVRVCENPSKRSYSIRSNSTIKVKGCVKLLVFFSSIFSPILRKEGDYWYSLISLHTFKFWEGKLKENLKKKKKKKKNLKRKALSWKVFKV